MQQATSANEDLASASGKFLPSASPQTSFVINLCASTTPVGLVHPSHPQLKRFTFFVSRRREEGRERFRLHMGYFSSQEAAEKLLDAVRDIYPAAWAGVAPGQNLRSRTPASGAARTAEPAAPAAPPAAATATPAAPTATAAPAPLAPATPSAAAPPRSEQTATHSLSNVRAAIDSLRDRTAPEPKALRGAQVLHLLESATPSAAAARPVAVAPIAAAPRAPAVNTAPQLRAVPPMRAPTPASAPAPVANAPAPRRETAAPPELAAYAVQLLWSVQPIDMSQIPQLAIFAAYTLYGAEGNRDGRRWYGLRLGFFTDAVSAKQVAQYVRSEFKSVSVVPVTQRERTRASAATAKPLPATAATKTTGHELNFIEDIPTDTAMSGSRPALQLDATGNVVRTGAAPATGAPDIEAIISELAKGARAGTGRGAARGPGGKRVKLRVAQGAKPVSKRPKPDGPRTLEETLEILGASTLQLDNGRGELMNDASSHDRGQNAAKSQRSSRFGRLMDRLAERFSGS